MKNNTTGPKCPNHTCPLEGLDFPMKTKGIGMCPVSGASFTYEADIDESKVTVDKNGNKTKAMVWKISGQD